MGFKNELIRNQSFLENVLLRRFFYGRAFEVYDTAAGLFDLGPNGCALKTRIEDLWRKWFVYSDDLLELCCTNLTPYCVFKASGHVAKFQDAMVTDVNTGELFRADKIISELLHARFNEPGVQQDLLLLESMTTEQIDAVIAKYNLKTPKGNAFTPAVQFNLMFKSNFGVKSASEHTECFLRPETAQGIFLNFNRLYDQNCRKLPFGGATIGTAFRNEISPRNGLLRVREFYMAEIEYFYDPENLNNFMNVTTVLDCKVNLFSRECQVNFSQSDELTIQQALDKKVICNPIMAYYIGRTMTFLQQLGFNNDGIRFRQHLQNEMAHYANDCWDAEVLSSYGWIEVIGIADRSAFDLQNHAKASGTTFSASRVLAEPRKEIKLTCLPNKKEIATKFKAAASGIISTIAEWSHDKATLAQKEAETSGSSKVVVNEQEYLIPKDLVTFKTTEALVTLEKFTPHVIEPSFGIGRLIYCLLEHSFKIRDATRSYFTFNPLMTPYVASICPISMKPCFDTHVKKLRDELLLRDIRLKNENQSGSIGKRYSRLDEIGVSLCITIDFNTLETDEVTIRERNSMQQIKVPMKLVPDIVLDYQTRKIDWEKLVAIHGLHKSD